jgi:hypothetical protein
MTAQNLHREDIKPSATGQDSIMLLHQRTRLSGNPSTLTYSQTEAKAHLPGAIRNRKHYFQKGLVTNRNKPGLFTHHFNTAANYNRLKSVHMTK